jgi:hypothetical protein
MQKVSRVAIKVHGGDFTLLDFRTRRQQMTDISTFEANVGRQGHYG